MDIRYVGKNLTVTEGMKEHLQSKIARFEKYTPRIVGSYVVLKKEKYLFDVQITLMAKNFQAYGESRQKENIYTAIDQACERVEKQLKRFREKVKDHHRKQAVSKASKKRYPELVLDGGAAGGVRKPVIIRKEGFAAKPMSPEEASLQLELSPQEFLVFWNPETKNVNVIYKRNDGNHGLIEPDF